MDEIQDKAKKEAEEMVRELRQELQCLNGDERVAEFDQFAVVKHDSGILTVVSLDFEKTYEFMSIDTAAEFVIMNADKFIDEEAS